jgi:hypothetical protein
LYKYRILIGAFSEVKLDKKSFLISSMGEDNLTGGRCREAIIAKKTFIISVGWDGRGVSFMCGLMRITRRFSSARWQLRRCGFRKPRVAEAH